MRRSHLAHALAASAILGLCMAGTAWADHGADPDRPGSILIFPKVVNTASRDTIIRISNTGNTVNNVHCYYVNGTTCGAVDFELSLTKQQPTQWSVSNGRAVFALDPFANSGSGMDPGLIPPAPAGFEGALICLEVAEGQPVAQNKLKGEAVLQEKVTAPSSGNTSTYNALAIASGTGSPQVDNVLSLDGSEYNQCAKTHRVDFVPEGAPDPVFGTDVVTNVIALPCELDLSRALRTRAVLQAKYWNEFEIETTNSIDFACWGNFPIDGGFADLTTFGSAQFTSDVPVVMLVESLHFDEGSGTTSTAIRNVHRTSAGANSTIRLPRSR